MCGYIEFGEGPGNPVLDALSEVVVVRSVDAQVSSRVDQLARLMLSEAEQRAAGWPHSSTRACAYSPGRHPSRPRRGLVGGESVTHRLRPAFRPPCRPDTHGLPHRSAHARSRPAAARPGPVRCPRGRADGLRDRGSVSQGVQAGMGASARARSGATGQGMYPDGPAGA